MWRLRGVITACAPWLWRVVSSATVGLLAIGRGSVVVSPASQADVARAHDRDSRSRTRRSLAPSTRARSRVDDWRSSPPMWSSVTTKTVDVSFDQLKTGFQTPVLVAQRWHPARSRCRARSASIPCRTTARLKPGRTKFCRVEGGEDDCGAFQFVLVWQKQDGRWRWPDTRAQLRPPQPLIFGFLGTLSSVFTCLATPATL